MDQNLFATVTTVVESKPFVCLLPLPPFDNCPEERRACDNLVAFFEAYFSNYIEGTIFEVEEAEGIVFDNRVPKARLVDAHDILSTYKIVSDPNEMGRLPRSALDLEDILKSRHKFLFEERPDILPGQFKTTNNQVGSTVFVHPDYVKGTLQKGFDLYQSLPVGLARAIFMQFLFQTFIRSMMGVGVYREL